MYTIILMEAKGCSRTIYLYAHILHLLQYGQACNCLICSLVVQLVRWVHFHHVVLVALVRRVHLLAQQVLVVLQGLVLLFHQADQFCHLHLVVPRVQARPLGRLGQALRSDLVILWDLVHLVVPGALLGPEIRSAREDQLHREVHLVRADPVVLYLKFVMS